MAMAICSECGSPIEITEGEEWGYCPMCENGQVELKKNLELSLENAVEFKFRYLTKNTTILTTENIGSFFNDEHFNKFECSFWNLATVLYNFEHEDKGE